MTAKFEIKHEHNRLVGVTRVDAAFRPMCYRYFFLQGAAEIASTDAYVRAVQHWASLSVVTYYFSEWRAVISGATLLSPLLGALVQFRNEEALLTLRPEAGETFAAMIAGASVVIEARDEAGVRKLVDTEWINIAALHLELPRPFPEPVALYATSCTLPLAAP